MTFFRTTSSIAAPNDLASAAEDTHRATLAIRRRYGLDRLQLGLMLDAVQEHKLWAGKAESFTHYLADLRVNPAAARQYMTVAKKFIVELQLSEAIIDQLAMCNMTVLYEAAKRVTLENLEDVLSSVLVLHQRDALQCFNEMDPTYDFKRDPPQVNRVVGQFYELPDDLRISVLSRIARSPRALACDDKSA